MRKSFLFLGFAIPDSEMQTVFRRDRLPAVQTHRFVWNLIKAILSNDTFDCTFVCTRPVSDYPGYPHRIVRSANWCLKVLDRDIEIKEIPFLNFGISKVVTRFLSGLFYSIAGFHAKHDKCGVIVYSVHVPFMLIGYIVSLIYGIDFIAVWTDPPAVPNAGDGWLKSRLRNVERYLSVFLMRKAKKVISITRHLAEDFAPYSPYLVMEGIVDCTEKCAASIDDKARDIDQDRITFVYTGSLEKRYGVDKIVEAFLMMEDDLAILEIYGRGSYEEELKAIYQMTQKVRYHGFVSQEEAVLVQRRADFLIDARSPEDEYVRYSFPSKILEYMLSGTPVLTTILPGMPEDYRDYVIPLENNDPVTIRNAVAEAIKLDKQKRAEIGRRAMEFAKLRDYRNQGRRIGGFLGGHK